MKDAVRRHLRENHGVLSRAEALEHGLSPSQIARLLGRGEWNRPAPAVYRSSSAPVTWRSEVRAHVLSCGGLASHRTAAALWRIDGFRQAGIELTIENGRHLRRSRSTIVHESTQMDLAAPTVVDAIPTTGLARTVLDIAAVVGPRRIQWAVDAVIRDRLLQWPDLYSVLVNHSARGRDGCGRLRAVLDVSYGAKVVPDSRWNRMVADLLVSAGLPAPIHEVTVKDPVNGRFVGRVDLAYPDARLAIECDSVRWHLNRESFERDPRRKNALLLSGWRVLTFTWSDYVDQPERLCATVRRSLGDRNLGD